MSARTMTASLFVLAASAGLGAAQDAGQGQALYLEKCGMCHLEANNVGGMGTFLLAKRDPDGDPLLEHRAHLIPEYVELAVRTGIGNMPRISRAEVSDAQLAEISAYLAEAAQAHASAPEAEDVSPPPADPIQ